MKSGSQGVKLIALPADIMDSTYPRVKSQLVEQWTENPCVTGSSPVPGIYPLCQWVERIILPIDFRFTVFPLPIHVGVK